MSAPRSVLLTGAAGRLGSVLRRSLAGRFPLLRVSDVRPLGDPRPGEETVICDLRQPAAVASLVAGIDAIVHLGGIPNEQPWPLIADVNILGSYTLWEAARQAGVERIVFASSNHAVGFHRRSRRLDHDSPTRPDSRYGLSKVFGEGVARLYADKHGVRGFCMRIGSCTAQPEDARALATWLSHGDLDRLVMTGLNADYRFAIVYGISANTRAWWDNRLALRLGYAPRDDAERWAPQIEAKVSSDPVDEAFQGGRFCASEFGGKLDAID
ncbi:MAG: NAD-dependent epimerase/dehydratase family protein [Lautropia sp.]